MTKAVVVRRGRLLGHGPRERLLGTHRDCDVKADAAERFGARVLVEEIPEARRQPCHRELAVARRESSLEEPACARRDVDQEILFVEEARAA